MRASSLVAIALALAPIADAKTKPRSHALAPAVTVDPHAALAAQVAAEQATMATTIETVTSKLAAADRIRARRVVAAIRIAEAPSHDGDGMAAARRLAAARYLLARDADERTLLADELGQLRRAEQAVNNAAAAVEHVALPEHLMWPATGTIARRFGEYQHERSKAILSRRGIDIEVDDHAVASAPADGVVRYAGPIRGLDHGLVIDCGSYFTVVAKLGDLALLAGTHVSKGDRLGRAARHRVYLEVRAKVGAGGLPIDPEPLLK